MLFIWLLSLVFCSKVHSKKVNNVNAIKKDTTDPKGILTDDPYLDATHYWPFESEHDNILTQDIVTGRSAILLDGAEVKNDTDFGNYVSTEKNGSYIIAGDFKGTCFSDPGKCVMNGLTISFWVKLNQSKIRHDQDAYILSSGGQSKKSRGFAFLYFHGEYVACLSTKDKQWKMTIKHLPLNEWINIAFVWRNNEQLRYFLNGSKVKSVDGTDATRNSVKYTILTISRPNNAVNKEFMYPLSIASLGLWDKALRAEQIKSMVKLHDQPDLRHKRNEILRGIFATALKNKRTVIKQHK